MRTFLSPLTCTMLALFTLIEMKFLVFLVLVTFEHFVAFYICIKR